jgi:outer membrane receptor protein involved in Fe transport
MSVNAGNTTAYGVEAEIKHFLNEYIQWFVNYTFTHSKVVNDIDADQDGANIPFVPNHMVNVGATVRLLDDLVIAPYLHYVGTYYDSTSKSGRQKFGQYATINAHLQKGIVKNVVLNLDLTNITNNKYEMPWQFRDPGFAAFGSLELVF